MNLASLFPVFVLFLVLTLVNLYFRKKVMTSYRKLADKNVEFGWRHIWNQKLMEQEVYPHHDKKTQEHIGAFLGHIKQGLTTFIILITLIGLGSLIYINIL